MPEYKWYLLSEIFQKVTKGDIHESNLLEAGSTPIIGCGFVNDGVEGYFDTENFAIFENAITIASDGSYPLTAFYHNYKFAAKDNVVICSFKKNTTIEEINYILYIINTQTWRFSYGRKCYYNKMMKLKFPLPVDKHGNVDIDYIKGLIKTDKKGILPEKTKTSPSLKQARFETFVIGRDIQTMSRGSYHAKDELDPGKIPLISCGEFKNGCTGFFDIPSKKQYKNTLTIAYNAKPLTTKFHISPFGTKDDVAVFKNTNNLKISTLLFIGAMLNKQTWRFSYGRKCFNQKLSQQSILLPVTDSGDIDEEYIEELVKAIPYWNYFKSHIENS